jgi:hypothetical protein
LCTIISRIGSGKAQKQGNRRQRAPSFFGQDDQGNRIALVTQIQEDIYKKTMILPTAYLQ